jgi:DNA-binding response OmpR family regulator
MERREALILMVEDSPDVLANNAEYLGRLGYETVAAPTLERARFLLEERAPDLILLDVMMPDGSGFGFCAEIKRKTSAPVIFLTAKSETDSELAGLRGGGDDYITKPYSLEILAERIKLRLAKPKTGNVIDLPPLHMEREPDFAALFGKTVHFSPTEMKLSWALAEKEGLRVSCGELCRKAWNEKEPNGRKNPKIIKPYISRIRKKLQIGGCDYFEIRSTNDGAYVFNQVKFS